MQTTHINEYITGMFVAGMYYWLMGDELSAAICWKTGADVVNHTTVVMVS